MIKSLKYNILKIGQIESSSRTKLVAFIKSVSKWSSAKLGSVEASNEVIIVRRVEADNTPLC